MQRASIIGLLAALASAQVNFSTANWQGLFSDGSGVLQSLQTGGFDFSPSDVFSQRNGTHNYHTGDLNLRFRAADGGGSDWTDVRTAAVRNVSLTNQGTGDALLASNLVPALPGVEQYLNVSRTWSDDHGDLALQFDIANVGSDPVELGAVGMPIEFNNIFTGRMAVDTTNRCVLYDPYIGLDAGYVQVSRLTGTGPELVLTPLNDATRFEAWNFLAEDTSGPLYYQSQTYEGNYEWLVYSQAYAEQEWNATQPWNDATSMMLAPGASARFGLRFSSPSAVSQFEDVVAAQGIPVAVGVPGYVLPSDVVGSLYLNHTSPVSAIHVSPADAVSLTPMTASLPSPWVGYAVAPAAGAFGRVRATITYADGRDQTVHYHIAHSAPQALDELGHFSATRQVFNDTADPFHRAPSVITYDSAADAPVLQDKRAWIAGLSDEGGAGSFLAAAVKQMAHPVASEVALLEHFVHDVVWGALQIANGTDQYAVRKSLFFYDPAAVPGYAYDPAIDFSGTWDQPAAYLVNRAYDYVHVSALYYALYAADVTAPGILTVRDPTWYLDQSYRTVLFALSQPPGVVSYADLGLMGETIWGSLLAALHLENMTSEAQTLTTLLQQRQRVWSTQANPYGSEMAWDSTGQEGVYHWSNHFNDTATAEKTLASIRGYTPTLPHWGYNGNARRYWDFLYAGAPRYARIERQLHHYGSGLNAQPLLTAYRQNPEPSSSAALHDLRIAYGAHMGPLSNIQATGSSSMAFHSFADTLAWDTYTGDFGPGFLGHVLSAACYLVEHPIFGVLAFGGNLLRNDSTATVSVAPRDSLRRRAYIAPLGLWVVLDAGTIVTFRYDPVAQTAGFTVGGRPGEKTKVVLMYAQTARIPGGGGTVVLSTPGLAPARGGYVVDVAGGDVDVGFASG